MLEFGDSSPHGRLRINMARKKDGLVPLGLKE